MYRLKAHHIGTYAQKISQEKAQTGDVVVAQLSHNVQAVDEEVKEWRFNGWIDGKRVAFQNHFIANLLGTEV